MIFISLLGEMELKAFKFINIWVVSFQKLPENPERMGSSQFKSTVANPGSAASFQLPDMEIPREFLFLAASGTSSSLLLKMFWPFDWAIILS